MMGNILIACDHAGFELKQRIQIYLKNLKINYTDLGCHDQQPVDYPDYAHILCQQLRDQLDSRVCGVLICGTGIGMSIAANRHSGIRAAVCNEGTTSAFYARAHNNANILCLGARLINSDQAIATLQTFMQTPFEKGRHIDRLHKIDC